MLETSAKIIILIAILVRVQQLPQMLSMKDYVLCVREIFMEAETFGPVMQKNEMRSLWPKRFRQYPVISKAFGAVD
jgi:hypothetical protein